MSENEPDAAGEVHAVITAPAPAMPAQWRPLPPEAATTAMYGGTGFGLLIGIGGCASSWAMLSFRALMVGAESLNTRRASARWR